MVSRSQKTQRGNPHQLAIRQHIFPKRSIERFCARGGVDLLDLKREKTRRARPEDVAFCADRTWNHGAETGWMKDIEDAFQPIAEMVVKNPEVRLGTEEATAVSAFYALWRSRSERRHLPKQTLRPNGVLASRVDYTADELELLERNGVIAASGDGSFAMRDIMTPVISLAMGRYRAELAGREWNVVSASNGEFCVPDVPAQGIVPITPTLALHVNHTAGSLSSHELLIINGLSVLTASEYIFGRSLDACPGVL